MRELLRPLLALLLGIALPAALAADSRTERYYYDAGGRLVEVRYSDGSSIRYEYDRGGNLLTREASATSAGPFPVEPAVSAAKSGGDLLITYPIAACNAADHAVIFGVLGDFASATAAECSVGNDGSALVTPPGGSVWFVVAGVEGGAYSSLGLASDGSERNVTGVDVFCAGLVQDTSGACP